MIITTKDYLSAKKLIEETKIKKSFNPVDIKLESDTQVIAYSLTKDEVNFIMFIKKGTKGAQKRTKVIKQYSYLDREIINC